MKMIEIHGKGGIFAKMVLDSISPQGIRLPTMHLRYHRFIHSEIMTHRMFSRNASSSRAIPAHKMIDRVINDPATPIHWGKNQPGMQAIEEVDGAELQESKTAWINLSKKAAIKSQDMQRQGLHKQIANRVTEPFQFIDVIVTATELNNFFNLRLHADAQPEIQELARCMRECLDQSTPVLLNPGDWHTPYVTAEEKKMLDIATQIKCSAARVARISYNNHDGTPPALTKDVGLHDKLIDAGHLSVSEHQATPMRIVTSENDNQLSAFCTKGVTHLDRNGNYWSNNLRGFIQYRATL